MKTRSVEAAIAARLGWSQKRVHAVLDIVTDGIVNSLAAEQDVALSGLGTFATRHRGVRRWRSPKQEAVLLLPPKQVIWFRTSRTLRRHLGGGD